jgi:hypothetical protein
MKSRYNPRQKTLRINEKPFKRLPKESRSQYWNRYFKAGGK